MIDPTELIVFTVIAFVGTAIIVAIIYEVWRLARLERRGSVTQEAAGEIRLACGWE